MILIMGYGNALRSDDALGCVLAKLLGQCLNQEDDLRVYQLHQLTPELVERIAGADYVIFIDARADGEPGTVVSEAVSPQMDESALTHTTNPSALLGAAHAWYGAETKGLLISVVGACFDYGDALSPEITALLPRILNDIEHLIVHICTGDIIMHEFGIVDDIVKSVLPQLYEAEVEHVASVHFRRGSAFSEDALRQAYKATTQGTPLEDAVLWIDTVNLDYQCPCGYQQVITSDDLEGHMFICPMCGAIHEVNEAHDLELVEMLAEMV